MTPSSNKKAIRQRMLGQRKTLDDSKVLELSQQIVQHLIDSTHFSNANCIMTYLSYPKEVQTDSLVSKAINLGKTVSVPVCNPETKDLFPSQIYNLNMVEQVFFGLREPLTKDYLPVQIETLDLIIIPGLAFDLSGNRIGHGAGYYDRFLSHVSHSIPKIGLAFQNQIVKDQWNHDNWDVKMDAIITENGWIYNNI